MVLPTQKKSHHRNHGGCSRGALCGWRVVFFYWYYHRDRTDIEDQSAWTIVWILWNISKLPLSLFQSQSYYASHCSYNWMRSQLSTAISKILTHCSFELFALWIQQKKEPLRVQSIISGPLNSYKITPPSHLSTSYHHPSYQAIPSHFAGVVLVYYI